MSDSLKLIQPLRAHVIERLRLMQTPMVQRVLRQPHRHVRIRPVDLPNMARQPLEVPVPMHRYEISAALPGAMREEVPQPVEACRSARDRRCSELDAELLQRLDDADPGFGRGLGVDAAAAVGDAVGLVEGQDVGDVGATFDEVGYVIEEGGVAWV